MITKEHIEALVAEYLGEENELFLVEVKVVPTNKITVFLDSDNSLSIDDCVALSRWLNEQMDREVEDYELQVSSAGVGSPFKVRRQYVNAMRKNVEVAVRDGRKIHGKLVELHAEYLVVEVERKVLVEGKKKKQIVTEYDQVSMDEINSIREIITF